MNEQEQFLADLETKGPQTDPNDPFEASLLPEDSKKSDGKQEDVLEEVPDEVKNRRHKRLESQLKAEREANIALASRLDTLSEIKKESGESEGEYLKRIERLYGTDTPEAITATELLKEALKGVKDDAKREAIEEFRKEQRASSEAVKNEEGALDSMLEDIEDEYNVDLTSQKAEELRKTFFKRVEKLSPKDATGNILHYADHRAVWEDIQDQIKRKPVENRAKDISARSMSNTVAADNNSQDDPTWKFLRENGF